MKKTLLLLTSLSLFATQSNAVLLTFDDVPGGSVQNFNDPMPTYKGFTFSYTLDWIDVEGPNWNFGARSGDFALVNTGSAHGIIKEENGRDFTFDGLWAKKWATPKNSGGADSLFGALQGYNNGALTWSVDIALNGSYKEYSAQTGLIDELRLAFGSLSFLVDDLALNISPVPILGSDLELNEPSFTSPVPEPSSIALMLGGLGLVGFMAARRAKKA